MKISRRNIIGLGATITALSSTNSIAESIAPQIRNSIYIIDSTSGFRDVPSSYSTVIVSDKFQGGVFSKITEQPSDQGIIFNGNNSSWKRLFSGAVNVKWFGAKGDGLTIDTSAFEAAINTGKEVFVPEGHYIIDSTLESETIFIHGEKSQDASVIEYTGKNDTPLFRTTGYYKYCKYITFSNLKLKGSYSNLSNNNCTAIELDNRALSTFSCDNSKSTLGEKLIEPKEDIDTFVKECHISGFNKAIHIYGRGLYVDNCTFSVTKYAVYFDRHSPIREFKEDDQKAETGARAYWVRNSRFHAMSGGAILCNIEKHCELLKGLLFSGNYIDSSVGILNGACRESLFTGNTHIYGNKDVILFDSEFNWKNVTITNNNFSAIQASSSNAERENKHIIRISNSHQKDIHIFGLNFSNNNIYRVDRETIKLKASSVVNTTISHNTMSNICKNARNKPTRVIDINADTIARNNIDFNIISIANESDSTVQKNLDYIVKFTGNTYDTTCLNNKFNNSLLYTANKSAFTPNSIVQLISGVQTEEILRVDPKEKPQLLISKRVKKKSITSHIIVKWSGILKGGKRKSLARLNIYTNNQSIKNNYYATIPPGDYLPICVTAQIASNNVEEISLYVSNGSTSAQDFSILKDSVLSIEEIEQ